MCDRAHDWLKEAVLQKGPILLGALCPRMLHEGPWYGLAPTGYKLMRRAPHSKRAPPWGQLNKHSRNFNGERGSGTQNTYAA